jgi:hypothetical protein
MPPTPGQTRHPYQGVVTAVSLALGVLYAGTFFLADFRTLYDKYLPVPAFVMPGLLFAMGFTFGLALTVLAAPPSFLHSRAGQDWLLSRVPAGSWLGRVFNRLKCLGVVLLLGWASWEVLYLALIEN